MHFQSILTQCNVCMCFSGKFWTPQAIEREESSVLFFILFETLNNLYYLVDFSLTVIVSQILQGSDQVYVAIHRCTFGEVKVCTGY